MTIIKFIKMIPSLQKKRKDTKKGIEKTEKKKQVLKRNRKYRII